jgi:hypothetical protein
VKYHFSCQVDRLPYCCGVYEVGNFYTNTCGDANFARYPNEYRQYIHDDPKSAHEAALKKLLEDYPNFCLQFWFYKPADFLGSYDNSEYVENEFRELIKAHPNCTELAEYVNKNSGNMVNGFMINNCTTVVKSEVMAEELEVDDDD